MNEYEELLLHLTGVDEDDEDDYIDQIEDNLIEEYNLDITSFEDLMNNLLPNLTLGVSPLTGEPFVGFSKDNIWLWKKPIKQEFLHSLIMWMGEGELLKKDEKGFIREIISNGVVEYELTLAHGKKKESNEDLND